MTQYISKSAIVAEIERRIKSVNSCPFRTAELGSEKFNEGQLNAYNVMLSFLNTLEVKEVDLDTDFGVCWGEYCDCGGNINDYKIAKHFFELGLKAQKGGITWIK